MKAAHAMKDRNGRPFGSLFASICENAVLDKTSRRVLYRTSSRSSASGYCSNLNGGRSGRRIL